MSLQLGSNDAPSSDAELLSPDESAGKKSRGRTKTRKRENGLKVGNHHSSSDVDDDVTVHGKL